MTRTKSRPVMVVIVGMTGAGKTTFASIASGQDLKIGHGNDPCTEDPQAILFELDGRTVALIDTPGFDDTARSDMEILADLGKWLVTQGFVKNQRLDGLILLHPVTEQRVGSDTEKRRTRLIQKILGKDAFKRVVIATTMWGLYDEEHHAALDNLMGFRQGEGGVWGEFCKGGATIVRHYNTAESAHGIIRSIMAKSDEAKEGETLLQKELASKSGGGLFTDTTAGKELRHQLEEEIDLTMDQLLEHRSHRPSESWRRSRDKEQRQKWSEWDEARQNLIADLELRQGQLKKLNGFVFRLVNVWTRLFTW